MRDGERPAVEFLESGPDAEPVAGRPRPAPGRSLLLGLAAVALAALAAVAARGLEKGADSRPAAAPATKAAPPIPAPVTSGSRYPGALRPTVPRLELLPTPRCAAAGCAVLDWVADATLYAVERAFPGESVVRQMTAFGPSDAGAAHPLLARELVVHAARTVVVIDVVQAADPKWQVTRVASRGAVVRGSAFTAGFKVAVRVVDGGVRAVRQVERLLEDPGLMAVR